MIVKYLKARLKEVKKEKRGLRKYDYKFLIESDAIISFIEKCIYMEENQ